jgi:hypothetical protein
MCDLALSFVHICLVSSSLVGTDDDDDGALAFVGIQCQRLRCFSCFYNSSTPRLHRPSVFSHPFFCRLAGCRRPCVAARFRFWWQQV